MTPDGEPLADRLREIDRVRRDSPYPKSREVAERDALDLLPEIVAALEDRDRLREALELIATDGSTDHDPSAIAIRRRNIAQMALRAALDPS